MSRLFVLLKFLFDKRVLTLSVLSTRVTLEELMGLQQVRNNVEVVICFGLLLRDVQSVVQFQEAMARQKEGEG
ncbi:uncharacterized protein MONOS_17132 [Monocercomonoides exilis]|uniref:uncharacterized protein n=1 Tax=Monocercomonoides exilis TaxID=2049356 RepID=UPI003559EDE8|nr:hypothetical protein MONOS_17132 [Monocercomonoides exilis]